MRGYSHGLAAGFRGGGPGQPFSHDWDLVAGQMLAFYRWVLGRGDLPPCVRVD
jgi:hypothetical protein